MAKRRRPDAENIYQFAFFLALEGLVTPPPDAWPPRLFPPDIWTQAEIFHCIRKTYGRDAAKLARSMRLFTQH